MFRLCPVCKRQPLRRSEVKTCGANECLYTWRRMTYQQKADAVEEAAVCAEELIAAGIHPMRNPSPIAPAGSMIFPTEQSEVIEKKINEVKDVNKIDRENLAKVFPNDPELIDKIFDKK